MSRSYNTIQHKTKYFMNPKGRKLNVLSVGQRTDRSKQRHHRQHNSMNIINRAATQQHGHV
ncbi:hypothetical protein INR49_002276 [Caranx melampygus]|nr:hypothetical protein INR49_002276 [Caranx melampygus]